MYWQAFARPQSCQALCGGRSDCASKQPGPQPTGHQPACGVGISCLIFISPPPKKEQPHFKLMAFDSHEAAILNLGSKNQLMGFKGTMSSSNSLQINFYFSGKVHRLNCCARLPKGRAMSWPFVSPTQIALGRTRLHTITQWCFLVPPKSTPQPFTFGSYHRLPAVLRCCEFISYTSPLH